MKQLVILLSLWLVACGSATVTPTTNSNATPTTPPFPTLDPAEITLGQTVYDKHCAVCHGANLEGAANWKTQTETGLYPPPPHDATGHTWHHPDSVLLESIRLGASRLPPEFQGQSNMPAYEGLLSEAEITAVLSTIKNSWPAETRQLQWEATQMMDHR